MNEGMNEPAEPGKSRAPAPIGCRSRGRWLRWEGRRIKDRGIKSPKLWGPSPLEGAAGAVPLVWGIEVAASRW